MIFPMAVEADPSPVVGSCLSPVVYRNGLTIAVEVLPHRSGAPLVYRLDDEHGYWLSAPTTERTPAFTLPTGLGTHLNLEAIEADASGDPIGCASVVNIIPTVQSTMTTAVAAALPFVSSFADPLSCDQPFTYPHTISTETPALPGIALQQGIGGIVSILIDLDADGAIVATSIKDSPSPVLNRSALDNARKVTFAPAVFRCRTVASQYVYRVEYRIR